MSALVALAGGSASTAAAAGSLPGQGFLPDGRVWEMVSPPDKNGGDVIQDTARVRAAVDGSAVSFASLVGFADVQGFGIGTEYLSQRSSDPAPGSNGWSTHGITPRQQPMTLLAGFQAADPHYQDEFSADLTKGVFRAWSPLTDDSNTERVSNLYVRDDLRTAGAGSYQLVTESATPQPTPPEVQGARPVVVGASADFSQVFFESPLNLVDGAAGSALKLYEWVGGDVRLAGVAPDGNPAACGDGSQPVCSIGGQGISTGLYTRPQHVVSEDGSRVVFTAPLSGFGERSGVLYQRIDGTQTIHVNASERTDCSGDASCGGDGVADPAPDPLGSQPALFSWATPDGMRVFFTSAEQLTDEDSDPNTDDLYRYDAKGPEGGRLTRISVDENPTDTSNGRTAGVIGTSAGGDYVYFVAQGWLLPGSSRLGGANYGIYVWRDGDINFVAPIDDIDLQRNVPSFGADPNDRYQARVTPDGRHLLFSLTSGVGVLSEHGGVDYDHGGFQVRYLYDADSDELACVSCNPGGGFATADASTDEKIGSGNAASTLHFNRTLSDDGRYAFFNTRERLVAEDTNGPCAPDFRGAPCVDAYVYDALTGRHHLLSSGKSDKGSYFMEASADGRDVFFVTRERLSGWDVDGAYDVYDARVGGGFPEPPPGVAACVSGGCQGPGGPGAGGRSQALGGQGGPVPRVAGCSKHKRKLSRARKRLRRADGGSRKQARRAVRKARRQLRACRRGGR